MRRFVTLSTSAAIVIFCVLFCVFGYGSRSFAINATSAAAGNELKTTIAGEKAELATPNVKAAFSGGSGLVGDPFQLSTAQDMVQFAANVNAGFGAQGYYVLTNDIDLSSVCGQNVAATSSETNWVPIGYATWPGIGRGRSAATRPFKGTFDGQGHSITGLYINSTKMFSALFGCISDGAILKNFTVDGSVISTQPFTAGVVAYMGDYPNKTAPCQILNVGNKAKVSCIGDLTDLRYESEVGGIVGMAYLQNGSKTYFNEIFGCFNEGVISSTDCNVGGIAGNILATHVTGCLNTGVVSSTFFDFEDTSGVHIGGIVGNAFFNTAINGCANMGKITAIDTNKFDMSGAICGSTCKESGGNYWLIETAKRGFASFSSGVQGGTSYNETAAGMQTNRVIDGLNTAGGRFVLGYVCDKNYPVPSWLAPAEYPVVNKQPQDVRVLHKQVGDRMVVQVRLPETSTWTDAELSYQWYKNTQPGYDGATALEGETSSTCIPSSNETGYLFYFCTIEVKCSDGTVFKVRSDWNIVIVADYAPAIPSVEISEGFTIGFQLIPRELKATVTISEEGAGALSYQWYACSDANGSNAFPILGANTDTFLPPTDTVGTTYYYCSVVNTYMGSVSRTVTSTPQAIKVETLRISDVDTLIAFAQAVNSGCSYKDVTVYLAADIDLSHVCGPDVGDEGTPKSWEPIGQSLSCAFQGTFVGNGHTIRGLYINADYDYVGLFGVGRNASWRNLTVAGTLETSGSLAGGLVGCIKTDTDASSVAEVRSLVNIISYAEGEARVGGICGYADGTESNYVSFNRCANKGRITAYGAYVAGLVGLGHYAKLNACYNIGTITSSTVDDSAPVGGLSNTKASDDWTQVELTNCYNAGVVSAPNCVGYNVCSLNGSAVKFADENWWMEGTAEQSYSQVTNDASKSLKVERFEMTQTSFVNTLNHEGSWADSLKSYMLGSQIDQTMPCLKWEIPDGLPTVTMHPASMVFAIGQGKGEKISAAADLPKGDAEGHDGTITYQWFRFVESNEEAEQLTDAAPENDSFVFPESFTEVGVWQYYCLITNTWSGGSASMTTKPAVISVIPGVQPVVTITTQPQDLNLEQGSSDYLYLSVEAEATLEGTKVEDAEITYQWYGCSSKDDLIGVAMDDATQATFVPPSTLGDVYYYCVVACRYFGQDMSKVSSSRVKVTTIPMQILTADDLLAFSNSVAGGKTYEAMTVQLAADIDLSSVCSRELKTSWTPIGTCDDTLLGTHAFKGTFDGQRHTIYNLYISTMKNYQALFGYIDGAHITDLVVAGNVSGGQHVAGVVAFSVSNANDRKAAVIERVGNEVNVTSHITDEGYAGGILSEARASEAATVVRECYNKGTISVPNIITVQRSGDDLGKAYAGGICGNAYQVDISYCYNTGTISSSGFYIGGISGYSASITSLRTNVHDNCYNSGTIICTTAASDSSRNYHGAIMGMPGIDYHGTMPHSYYKADSDSWPLGYGKGYQRFDGSIVAVKSPKDISMFMLGADKFTFPELTSFNEGWPCFTWENMTHDVEGLQDAIESAVNDLHTTLVSVDGSDIDVNTNWVTQEAADSLRMILQDAQSINYSRASQQSDINTKETELRSAQRAFDRVKKLGLKPLDTSKLKKKITDAQSARDRVYSSEDGSDVYFYESWAPKDVYVALFAQIVRATDILDALETEKPGQSRIDDTTKTLDDALVAFNNSVLPGTKQVDKEMLKLTIQNAYELRASVIVSDGGFDVFAREKWASQGDVDTFTTAILDAESILNKDQTTFDDAVKAKEVLEAAAAAFRARIFSGLKKADKSSLESVIDEAGALLAETKMSANGTDILETNWWATRTQIERFSEAVTAAMTIRDNASVSQDEVTDALSELIEACRVFITSRAHGKQAKAIDWSALGAAITAADTARASVVESANGTDVPVSKQWVTRAEYDALVVVLYEAETILDNTSSTQPVVDAMAGKLNNAVAVFKLAQRSGLQKPSIVLAAVQTIATQAYTGSAIKPTPALTLSGKSLKRNVDYQLTYKNNVKAGIATITVTGIGSYQDTKSVNFTISKAKISACKVAKVAKQKYTGKAIKPKLSVTFKGKKLKAGTDYKISYKNNKKKGTAVITIKGKGSFTGTKSVKFKIVK